MRRTENALYGQRIVTNLGRQVFGGQCWTMPVVSNGRIYARNTKEGVCLDVAVQSAAR